MTQRARSVLLLPGNSQTRPLSALHIAVITGTRSEVATPAAYRPRSDHQIRQRRRQRASRPRDAAGLSAWQLLIAIRDPENRGARDQRSRLVIRVGHLLNGGLHSILLIEAMRILFGFGVDLSRARLRPIMDALGIFGLLSRGVMFAMIGVYLTRTAWQRHSQYAVGLASALGTLRQQPYGEWALGTVPVGLIIEEPYRRCAKAEGLVT